MKEILITSSVLIAAVLLARRLFRGKVSQRLIYASWLLVALRLLIPIQIGQSQYSVTALTEKIETQSKPIQQAQQVLQEPVAGPSREELYEQLLNDYIQENPELIAPETNTPVENPPEAAPPVTPEVQQKIELQVEEQITAPTVSEVLTAVWIIGISSMGAWFLTANLIFLRRAKKGAFPLPGWEGKVPARVSPNVPTPCLVGFFRPVIYLTPASVENEQTKNHVLTHEMAHLRHGDHIWAMVRCVCLCIYWFDPLVWIAASQSRRDCELACDESALKKLGDDERIAYGKTLLDTVAQSRSPVHLLETATAMNESKKQLKERVNFIVKKPRNILIAAICMILIAAIVAGCAFMGSKPTEPAAQTSASTTEPNDPPKTNEAIRYLLVETKRYDSNGNLWMHYTHSYDDFGRMISQTSNFIPSDRYDYNFCYHSEYTYDQYGNMTSYTENYTEPEAEIDTTRTEVYTYTYNSDGTIASYITEVCYKNASRTTTRYFEYDELGRLKTVKDEDYNGPLGEAVTCTYDSNGNLITAGSSSFTYGAQEHLTQYQGYPESIKYEYDSAGNLISKVDSPLTSWTYGYSNGVLSEILFKTEFNYGDDMARTYILDENGNVSIVVFDNGVRIEYFYEAMDAAAADGSMKYRYWDPACEELIMPDYHDNIIYYYLPRPDPY